MDSSVKYSPAENPALKVRLVQEAVSARNMWSLVSTYWQVKKQ